MILKTIPEPRVYVSCVRTWQVITHCSRCSSDQQSKVRHDRTTAIRERSALCFGSDFEYLSSCSHRCSGNSLRSWVVLHFTTGSSLSFSRRPCRTSKLSRRHSQRCHSVLRVLARRVGAHGKLIENHVWAGVAEIRHHLSANAAPPPQPGIYVLIPHPNCPRTAPLPAHAPWDATRFRCLGSLCSVSLCKS